MTLGLYSSHSFSLRPVFSVVVFYITDAFCLLDFSRQFLIVICCWQLETPAGYLMEWWLKGCMCFWLGCFLIQFVLEYLSHSVKIHGCVCLSCVIVAPVKQWSPYWFAAVLWPSDSLTLPLPIVLPFFTAIQRFPHLKETPLSSHLCFMMIWLMQNSSTDNQLQNILLDAWFTLEFVLKDFPPTYYFVDALCC